MFGKKFVCPFCDGVITQMNRYFASALKAKNNNDKEKMIFDLEQSVVHLEKMIASYKKK